MVALAGSGTMGLFALVLSVACVIASALVTATWLGEVPSAD